MKVVDNRKSNEFTFSDLRRNVVYESIDDNTISANTLVMKTDENSIVTLTASETHDSGVILRAGHLDHRTTFREVNAHIVIE